MKWFKNDTEITTGISTTIAGSVVTTSLTFIASLDYHLEVVECQAENSVLQNPVSTSKFIEVHCKFLLYIGCCKVEFKGRCNVFVIQLSA